MKMRVRSRACRRFGKREQAPALQNWLRFTVGKVGLEVTLVQAVLLEGVSGLCRGGGKPPLWKAGASSRTPKKVGLKVVVDVQAVGFECVNGLYLGDGGGALKPGGGAVTVLTGYSDQTVLHRILMNII